MEPLIEQAEDGVMYERVIFSNDVFVTAESVVELLKTRDGGYDMACGMDLAYWGSVHVFVCPVSMLVH